MPQWQTIVAFAAVAGFMVTIMIYRTNQLDSRMREIEIEQAQIWCAMNPETCMGRRDE